MRGIIAIVAIICIAFGAYLVTEAFLNAKAATGVASIVVGILLFIDVLIRDTENKEASE